MSNELKLQLEVGTKDRLARLGITKEYFDENPRTDRVEHRDLRFKTLADIRQMLDDYPPEAKLHFEAVHDYEDYYVEAEIRWDRPETDQEWADRLIRLKQEQMNRANQERAQYERLKQKYGDE